MSSKLISSNDLLPLLPILIIENPKKEHDRKHTQTMEQSQQRTMHKRTPQTKLVNFDYGPHTKQVEPSEEEIQQRKIIKLNNLKVFCCLLLNASKS